MKTFKKTLCLVLVVAMALSLFAVAASAKSLGDYSDSSAVDSKYVTAVDFNTQLGVLRGNTTTTYNAKGNLTRAQLATIIYRITTGDVNDLYVKNYANGTTFADVASTDWYAGYVNYCADNGLLKGVGGDKYAPNSYLTGYQAMAALLRAIGYDANDEFVGKDWTQAVTKYAREAGINTGIVADWANPISREVTAQLVFNTVFAEIVKYVPLFGYYPTDNALSYKVFNLAEDIDGFQTFDKYGRPVIQWTDEDTGKVVVSVSSDVSKTYHTPVDGCQILVDAGIPKTNLTTAAVVEVWDGEYDYTYTFSHADKECEEFDIGDYGVLTTLYVGGKDEDGNLKLYITCLDVYLAKVTKVASASHGVAAVNQAEVYCYTGYAYEPATLQNINTAAYKVGTYILVTKPASREETTWDVIGTPTTFNAKYEGNRWKYNAYGEKSYDLYKFDGKEYQSSYNWIYDATGLDLGGNYKVFLDQFGYVIGTELVQSAKTYGVLDRVYYESVKGVGTGIGDVVYMDGTKKADVTVKSFDGYAVKDIDADPSYEAGLSETASVNSQFTAPLYDVTDGKLLTQACIGEATVTKGEAKIVGDENLNNTIYAGNKTVYLYRVVDAKNVAHYTSYTGYNAAPSAVDAVVWYVVDTATTDALGRTYAKYVFVDAVKGLVDAEESDIIVTSIDYVEKIDDADGYRVYFTAYKMDGTPFTFVADTDSFLDDDALGAIINIDFVKGVANSYSVFKGRAVTAGIDAYKGTTFYNIAEGGVEESWELDGKKIYLVTPDGVKLVDAEDATLVEALNTVGTKFVPYKNWEAPSAYYVFAGF